MLRVFSLGMLLLVLSACFMSGLHQGGPASNSVPAALKSLSPDAAKRLLPDTLGQGHPVILDFGTKYCMACQLLKPKLDKLQTQYPQIKIVSYEVQQLSPEGKLLSQMMQVNTVPEIVFLSGQGKIQSVYLEDVPMLQLEQSAKALLAKS